MIEVLIDFVLIIFIVIFWYQQYKFEWRNTPPTPCVVENQTFTDPYGNLYTCDRKLQPIYNTYQPAKKYDGELSYFNLETHTISPYKPLDGYFEYRKSGLEPLYFKKNLVAPFIEDKGKIVIKNSCYGHPDYTKILVNIEEIGIVDTTKGTPYGICKDNKILEILYCDRYHDFIQGKCEEINPCVDRSDGYILEIGNNMYKYCRNNNIETVKCEPDYTLINYECIFTPCKNKPDGLILDYDLQNNTYRYCQGELIQIHLCEPNKRASSHGCIDNVCLNENGLNSVRNESMYMPYAVLCENGSIVKYIYNDAVDALLYNAYAWNGNSITYRPYLKHMGGMYTPEGWKSYVTPKYLPPEGIYVTFGLDMDAIQNPSLFEEIYHYQFIRIHFKLNKNNKIEASRYNELYVATSPENISFTRDIETPATVYSRLASMGYRMIILDEKRYVMLNTKPYYIQTCPDNYYVQFDYLNPCISKKIIVSNNMKIPYLHKSIWLFETDIDDNLSLIQYYNSLGDIRGFKSYSGKVTRYKDYLLTPNLNRSHLSPICKTRSLNPIIQEKQLFEDDWVTIINTIVKFDTDFYTMTFDPDYRKDEVVGSMSVTSVDNSLFLYNTEFQAYCLSSESPVIKLDVSYIEYNSNRQSYVAGYLTSGDAVIYVESKYPMYNYVYIDWGSIMDTFNRILDRNGLSDIDVCVDTVPERFNVRVRRDNDYCIITSGNFESQLCFGEYVLHSHMPMCVYKACQKTLAPFAWDNENPGIVNCKTNEKLALKCKSGEIPFLSINARGCAPEYYELVSDSKPVLPLYIAIHPDIRYVYAEAYAFHIIPSTGFQNYICGTKKTNLNNYSLDDGNMEDILKFILKNFTQENFDYLYSISPSENEEYSASFETDYLSLDSLKTPTFVRMWYTALINDSSIRVKVKKPRKETILLDGGYIEYLTFGKIVDNDKKSLYFIDYDNNFKNTYVYIYPTSLRARLEIMFGITCQESEVEFIFKDEFLSKLYLYTLNNADEYNPNLARFTNPRISDVPFERLEIDNDGFMPLLSQYITPKK